MTRLAVPAAALLTAVAAWLSQGTLAIATPEGPRIALLPVSASALGLAACAGVLVVVLARAGASLAPLGLLTLLGLPWVPVSVPAAFLMWSGSLRTLVWVAVMLLCGWTLARTRGVPLWAGLSTWLARSPRLGAGVFAFVLFGWAAWQVSPSVPGGDEPHYLVITQSLLLDGDLRIENNHRRGDYQVYYPGSLAPHYIRRGRDGEIYSIHAPGISAIVAPAFALGGYRGVVLFLLAIAACGSALTWHVAWRATRDPSAAWFGWAGVTLSATTIFHSFAVYPDAFGGVLVLTGVWAILRADDERASGSSRAWPWALHGAALALLPWLHSRFALLSGSLGALILLRLSATKNPAGKAVAFLAVPAASAIAWIGFFLVIYGVPDPSAPYGTSRDFSLAFVPGGLSGLLFDQRFGLFATAPVLLCAVAGLIVMLRRPRLPRGDAATAGRADRRLAIELLFVLVPYLITATSYAMWWAGMSAPARFASPAVPILAIPCAVAWRAIRHRATAVIAAGSLALTAFISAALILPGGGRLAYNTRDATALWLAWASRLLDLGQGLPAWFRGRDAEFLRDVLVWAVALVGAWWAARACESVRSLRGAGRLATIVTAFYAVAGMIALSVVFALHGVSGLTPMPSQLEVLRRVAIEPRALVLQVAPPRVLAADGLLALLKLESVARPTAGPGGRSDPTVAVFPTIPAGRYRVRLEGGGPGGWLMLGIGQDQFALRSEALTWPPPPIEIEFPVDVRALIVRGDEGARRAVRRVVVEPLSIVPAGARLTDLVARRAVKYEGASVFFLDDRSFAEPDAFWVGGSRQSTFVVQPARLQSSVDLHLRNAPVDNRLTLESGQWREELTLAPGEERHVQVPLGPGHRAVLVTATTTAGFRPSESTPGSRDDRFLGVWVKPGP